MITSFLRRHVRSIQLVALLLPLLVIFCYRLPAAYNFDNDFGRDLFDIWKITQGDITLLGPKLSFGGLHTGPYYYYLFAPVLALFPGSPEAVLYANALLTWLFLVAAGVIMLKTWKLPALVVTGATYWIGLSSYFLYAARGPGNAFSYIGTLTVLLALFPTVQRSKKWWQWLIYGLGWGVVVNFHLVILFILAPLAVGSLIMHWQQRSWYARLRLFISYTVGFSGSFAPLALFELTHNFVMIKNTFIDRSYQAFTNNTNLVNPLTTSANPLENTWLFINHANIWSKPGVVVLILAILMFLVWQRKKIDSLSAILIGATVGSYLLVGFVGRFQLAFHYFFPFIILTQMTVLYLLRQLRQAVQVVMLAGMLLITLSGVPHLLMIQSTRPIAAFRAAAEAVATRPEFAERLRSAPFQVYVTRETPLAPIGHEYRYFLATHDLVAADPSQYAGAQYLLWFAEQPVDLDSVSSWEIDQFGERHGLERMEIGDSTVFLFGKKN